MTTDFSRSTSPSRGPSPAAEEGSADTPNAPAGRGFRLLGMSGRPLAAVLVCWFFVIFDGYDLIVYGTVQSTLMKHWDLSSGEAGTVGSLAFFGMAVGAVGVGRISDRVGRKTAVIGSVLILSVFTALCTLAPSVVVFGLFRFCAGLGLGGLVPSVNALVADVVPSRFRSAWSTVMMSGVPIGGSIAAVIAQFVVPSHPEFGWRYMFAFALIPLVIGLPLAVAIIPGHVRTPLAGGAAPRTSFSTILRGSYLWVSVMFAVATFFTLLAWYGLGTWLPKLLETAGYDFGDALRLTLALNLGAVAGSVITGWAGDRFGPLRSGVVAAFLAGVALLFLLASPSIGWVYLILVFAGVGTHGTQILIISAISGYYPAELRGSALGWALGVGRIGAVLAPQLAGLLLQWGLGVNSNFVFFGGSAVISCLLLIALHRRYRSVESAATRSNRLEAVSAS